MYSDGRRYTEKITTRPDFGDTESVQSLACPTAPGVYYPLLHRPPRTGMGGIGVFQQMRFYAGTALSDDEVLLLASESIDPVTETRLQKCMLPTGI